MAFSAAFKGKDKNIYFYQGTADVGTFERKAEPSDLLVDFTKKKLPEKYTKLKLQFGEMKKEVPIYTRKSLMKGYPEYVTLTEGHKEVIFKPELEGWEAEDFKGKKWLLKYKNKKLIKKPLHTRQKLRRDGIIQKYWVR